MRRRPKAPALVLSFFFATAADATEVAVCTDLGPFTIELFETQAPAHAANFLDYVERGFYSGLVFHRVIPDFVVQTGGYDRGLQARTPAAPVENESDNGLGNERGRVGAARSANPHAATSQFYVNLQQNPTLDATGDELGYTVFGQVGEGMDVLDRIAALPTRAAGPFTQDVPEPLVGITSAAVLDRAKLDTLPEDSRADAIRAQVAESADAGRDAEVIEWMNLYRALCAPADPTLLIAEAAAALSLAREDRGRVTLDEYFELADESDAGYAEARAMYRQISGDDEPVAETVRRLLAARCPQPAEPQIPDASIASLDDMLEGQEAVRAYIADSEAFLTCLNTVIDDDTLELDGAQHDVLVSEHNAAVGRMEAVAAEYNRQRAIFLDRD